MPSKVTLAERITDRYADRAAGLSAFGNAIVWSTSYPDSILWIF